MSLEARRSTRGRGRHEKANCPVRFASGSSFFPGCARRSCSVESDATPANQPPAQVQQVAPPDPWPSGSVIVIAPPVTPSGKWVQIARPTADSDVAGFQGNFSAFRGAGEYTFTTTVFMPSGSGIATIQFEPFGQPVSDVGSFLHIDLMPDDKVRIDDDDASKFGLFPRDQPFIVQVTLDINSSSPSAHIVLSGAGTRRAADRSSSPPAPWRSGSAPSGWDGLPNTGRFDATNIVVSRSND
jgi:hypothetical protein